MPNYPWGYTADNILGYGSGCFRRFDAGKTVQITCYALRADGTRWKWLIKARKKEFN